MNQDQLKQVRRQLARERERAVRSLARLTNGARGPFSSETSGWLPAFEASDQARDAAEKEASLLLATKENHLLRQIDAALRRLDDEPEAFGYCQRCGIEIPFDRIEAIPHTRYCLSGKLEKEAGAESEERRPVEWAANGTEAEEKPLRGNGSSARMYADLDPLIASGRRERGIQSRATLRRRRDGTWKVIR